MNLRAYHEGVEAFRDGKSRNANPYHRADMSYRNEWFAGWFDAWAIEPDRHKFSKRAICLACYLFGVASGSLVTVLVLMWDWGG